MHSFLFDAVFIGRRKPASPLEMGNLAARSDFPVCPQRDAASWVECTDGKEG